MRIAIFHIYLIAQVEYVWGSDPPGIAFKEHFDLRIRRHRAELKQLIAERKINESLQHRIEENAHELLRGSESQDNGNIEWIILSMVLVVTVAIGNILYQLIDKRDLQP